MRIILSAMITALCLFIPSGVFSQTTYEHSLSWTDNSDNEDGFKIERKTPAIPGDNFGEIQQVGPNVITYTDTVTTGQERCYRVRAFNASGDSPYSNEDCALPKPGEPTGLSISVTVIVTVTTP